MVTKAQKQLKDAIESIHDDKLLKQVRVYILGLFSQKALDQNMVVGDQFFHRWYGPK